MFLRILKKDLLRKKAMNIIVALFVILASMFVASGLNNVIAVVNGTDYFFEQAGLNDYILIRKDDEMGANELKEKLLSIDEINSFKLEEAYFCSNGSSKKENGDDIDLGGAGVIQCYDKAGINFFDKYNKEPEPLKEGQIYLNVSSAKRNDLKVGDNFKLKVADQDFTFKIAGLVKDALFGTDMIKNMRILMNQTDYNDISALNGTTIFSGEFVYIAADDVDAVSSSLSSVTGIILKSDIEMIRKTYIMNMIVAFIMLILSICLIIVSFLILRFTISFSITEDFREIGVMKAIGVSNAKIRFLYVLKYLCIAIVGTLIGFGLSFPFGGLLLNSVSETMVMGNSIKTLVNILGSLIVLLTITGFAYLITGKVKKVTPVDAIRSGQKGERFKKKSALKLSRSKTNAPIFMAANDVLSSPKRYITITAIFALCTSFVMILSNTANTMNSDRFIDTFCARSDVYFSDDSQSIQCMCEGGDIILKNYLDEVENKLEENNMQGRCFIDIQHSLKCSFDGKEYSFTCQQGIGTTTDMYAYIEGTTPKNMYEIALTKVMSDKLDAHIGDTITIDYGSGPVDTVVSAYFDSMNQAGEIIRISDQAPTTTKTCGSAMPYQILFDDHPSDKEIENRIVKLKDILGEYVTNIENAKDFQKDCLGVVDVMQLVKRLLLLITMIVIILVVVLMERSFISEEKNEIAILKALGFKDKRIILYHILRFGIVSLVSVIVAGALSIPLTYLCMTPIFKMMGASKVNYLINPVELFVIYPLMIMGVTVLVSFLTALYTKKIKSSDTASIE